MIQENAKILSNTEMVKDIWKMEIKTQLVKEARPGQFIEIQVPPFFLRRPISIHEIKEDSLVIIYKVLGEGTLKMTGMKDSIDIFGPMGNGNVRHSSAKGARNAPFLLFDQNFNESVLKLKSGILRDGVGL